MNIYLVGFRGTGKSTIARELASRFGAPWLALDLDELLEEAVGKSIATMFEEIGEAGFRDQEEETLRRVSAFDHVIAGTGGGVVLRQANRDILKRGWVVWLTADAETIHRRVQRDPTTADRRPNLTTNGGIGEIRELLAARDPLYRDVANLVVANDQEGSIDAVVTTILTAWTEWTGSESPREPS
ncbi:Shikimate kinase [Planctomycetes bacterium Pan216]|uniref:Shikimate kinase n=1 Tax=Kolteria novifilia TaxID=2527975 RepID=A0A518BC67_9BACT|nr:Shikimate kinase [Planctomycetes bacterium Pan216]